MEQKKKPSWKSEINVKEVGKEIQYVLFVLSYLV